MLCDLSTFNPLSTSLRAGTFSPAEANAISMIFLDCSLFVFHDNAAAGEMNQVAVDFKLLLMDQQIDHGREYSGGRLHLFAQFFFSDPADQGMRFVEICDHTSDEELKTFNRGSMHDQIAQP